MRAKSNRVREGNGGRFQGRQKGKEKSFCFVVVQLELIFGHPCFFMSSVHALSCCCCNLGMSYDQRECVMSVLGTTKHS